MIVLIIKNMAALFYNHPMELHSKYHYISFHFHQYFQYILQKISSTLLFLHLQFLQSRYFPTSHDLLHSQSPLLGFQINPLSHFPLSVNYLHSHRYLSLFHFCLLSQTLASSLYLHLGHSICLA